MPWQERLNNKAAISQELADSGVDIKAGDSVSDIIESAENFGDVPEMSGFIYNYGECQFLWNNLDDDYKNIDYKKIEEFGKITDIQERINFLPQLKFSEIAKALEKHALPGRASKYFLNRLNHYNNLLEFGVENEYGNLVSINIKDVKTGLLRDAALALMMGTPEMAITKIAKKKVGNPVLNLRPGFKYPDTFEEGENDDESWLNEKIRNQNLKAHAYADVNNLYKDALKIVQGKYKDFSAQQLEHKVVLLAADWLAESAKYNPNRGPGSPYVGSFEESIAWARLGDQVKKQLRGARQKIMGIDFHNIQRFIGRSGDNKYEKDKKEIDEYVGYLEYAFDDLKENSKSGKIQQINQVAVDNLHDKYQFDFDVLMEKYRKNVAEVLRDAEKYKLPEEEKQLQLQSVENKIRGAAEKLQREYSQEVHRLSERGAADILDDARAEQKQIHEKYEKHKSLAQMALDLHFSYNHEKGKNHEDLIIHPDFINEVSFSDLKLAHHLWRDSKHEIINRYFLAKKYLPSGETVTREHLSDENFIVCLLAERNVDYIVEHKNSFDLDNLLKSEKVLAAAYQEFVIRLKSGWGQDSIDDAKLITAQFLRERQDMIAAGAKEGLIDRLERRDFDESQSIVLTFLTGRDDVLTSKEVISAAHKFLVSWLESGTESNINNAKEIIELFLNKEKNIYTADVILATKSGLLSALFRGDFSCSQKIIDDFLVDEDFLKSNEFFDAVQVGLTNTLKSTYGNFFNFIEKANNIISAFLKGRNDIVMAAAKEGLISQVESGRDGAARMIIQIFFQGDSNVLKSDEVLLAAKKRLLYLITNTKWSGRWDEVEKWRGEFLRGVDIFADLPDDLDKDELYLYLGEKSDWQQLFGSERIKTFLQTVKRRTDKTQDVARNAFTHTDLDRASKFFQFLNKHDLFQVNGEEFDIATEYIDKYSLATNKLLYSYFRALKFLNLQKGDRPVSKLEALLAEGKNLPLGIDRSLCLEMEKNEVWSLDILEKKYKQLATRVYSGEKTDAGYLKNISNFEKTLLRAVVGYDTHSFLQGRNDFDKIINDFVSYQRSSAYRQFPVEQEEKKNYKPINFGSTKIEYEFDPSLLADENGDFQVLRREFLSIFNDDLTRREIFVDIKDSVLLKLNKIIIEKKALLSESKDPDYSGKKLAGLSEEVSTLLELGLNILNNGAAGGIGENVYNELLRHILSLDKGIIKEFESEMRQIIFQKTVKKAAREGFVDLVKNLNKQEIDAQAVFSLVDLLTEPIGAHVLGKDNSDKTWDDDTWKAILEAKNSKKYNLFKLFESQLLRLKEISQSMKMVEGGEGVFNIKCYPCTDDFLGEVSGYLGNACYTKVYPLLRQYPSNLIPFKFVSERDQDNRELFGSVLVFELKDSNDMPVALLRPFNVPRESEIDVGKFIENFIEKITPVLKARGIKKILVPGDDGAISNYSLIKKHMHEKYIDGKKKVSLRFNFAFNGYDITRNCYEVRVFEVLQS